MSVNQNIRGSFHEAFGDTLIVAPITLEKIAIAAPGRADALVA